MATRRAASDVRMHLDGRVKPGHDESVDAIVRGMP